MLRLAGLLPLPPRTTAFVAVAIAALACGFLIELIGELVPVGALTWAGLPCLGLGAVFAILAARRAIQG